MNKQGQINLNMGLLISAAIAIIVGAVLMATVASYIGTATTTGTTGVAYQVTPAAVGGVVDLVGQELLSTPTVVNATADIACADNFTIAEGISSSTGLKRIRMTSNAISVENCSYVNVSYTYGPEGYIDSSGGRGVAGLILIVMGLLIGTVALTPVLRNKLLDLVGI